MPNARTALSANLAILSQALELSAPPRKSVMQRRREDLQRTPASDLSLEFEQGKPLKNFGRLLASSAGIPLPYNFRQGREAATAAEQDYQNQSEAVAATGDLFSRQMERNAAAATTESMRRQFTQYAEQGRTAVEAFFAPGASGQQRAAAQQQLSALNGEALKLSSAEAQDDAQQKRKVQLEQYVRSSNELLDVRSAVAETGRNVENYNRGRAALKGLNYDAPELQQFMRQSAAGVLGAAGQASAVGLGAINPMLSVLDRLLSAEGRALDPEVMDELINTIGKSNIEHGKALLTGLSESNQRIISESPGLRDMPAFGTVPFNFSTPATDAWWQGRSGEPVQRDITDITSIKNAGVEGAVGTVRTLQDIYETGTNLLSPGVEMTDEAKRRAEEAVRPQPGRPASGIIQRPTR